MLEEKISSWVLPIKFKLRICKFRIWNNAWRLYCVVNWTAELFYCHELLLRAIVSSILKSITTPDFHPPPAKLCNQPSRNTVSASSVRSFNDMPKTKVVPLLNFYFTTNVRSSLWAEAFISMFCFGADTLKTAFEFPQICPNGKKNQKSQFLENPQLSRSSRNYPRIATNLSGRWLSLNHAP